MKLNEACNIISVVGCFNIFHFNLKSPQAKSDESNLISCSQNTEKRCKQIYQQLVTWPAFKSN